MPYDYGDKRKNEANLLKDIMSVNVTTNTYDNAKVINLADFRK